MADLVRFRLPESNRQSGEGRTLSGVAGIIVVAEVDSDWMTGQELGGCAEEILSEVGVPVYDSVEPEAAKYAGWLGVELRALDIEKQYVAYSLDLVLVQAINLLRDPGQQCFGVTWERGRFSLSTIGEAKAAALDDLRDLLAVFLRDLADANPVEGHKES